MFMTSALVASEVVLSAQAIKPYLKTIDYFVIVLTPALLEDRIFADILVDVEFTRQTRPVELRPVLADATFAFPGLEYYQGLEAQNTLRSMYLVAGLRRAFNVIALAFTPHSSTGIMAAQVGAILCRMARTSEPVSSYAVDASPFSEVDATPFAALGKGSFSSVPFPVTDPDIDYGKDTNKVEL